MSDPDLPIDKVMRPGPSTFRPFVSIEEIAKRMDERNPVSCPITTSDGRLVGLLRREDVAAALEPGVHAAGQTEGEDG